MNRIRRGDRRPIPRPYAPQPLMGNQLGLQDIDLELELLKRKRQIIEQQQQMLNNDCLSGNRFGEFSHMYEDPGSYGPSSSGAIKRPQVWEHDSPPKRFATWNTSVPSRPFNSQFRAQVKKPISQAGFQPRSGPNPPVAKKKDFKPNKVSKPTPVPPPNKLNTHSQAERRTLVTKAMTSTKAVTPEPLILRPDRPASNQLNGRLELALGHIVKEIKSKFPEYDEQMTNNVGRALKQTLRDRLRTCMMGRPVNMLNDTVNTYRESFPPETDKDLLLSSLEAQTGTDFVSIESDNPQEFFTKNLGRLMTRKLEEMFGKLGEIYSPEIPPEKFCPKKLDLSMYKKNPDVIEKEGKPAPADAATTATATATADAAAVVEDTDVQIITEKKENNEVYDICDIDKETEPKTDKKEEKYNKIASTEEFHRLHRLMSTMLPYMLKKFTPEILRIMKLDGMYRKTFNNIKQDLRKKITSDLNKIAAKKVAHLPNTNNQNSDVVSVEDLQKEEKAKNEILKKIQPLYYVKVYGRPTLPKRKAMETFFDNFKPKTIKKHRTIHNILFVGFCNKENYDNILAAHGTIIGRNTLYIKVSERAKPNPDGDNDSLDIINEDLDDQITELLTSIKQSEGILGEDDVEMTPNDTKPEEKAENETIMDDKETKLGSKVEVTDITDTKAPENGITDKVVQENGAKKEAVEENNKEDSNAATENVAQAADTEKIDANTEKQDEVAVKDENNAPTKNETDENLKQDKGDVENITEIESEKKDTVAELKSEVKEVKGTPTRSSARLATTPSGIRTRRASKLSENNS